jgi:hypothetical protein
VISSPTGGSVITPGTSASFVGSASDPDDGDLGASLNWDSDLDGPIGTGGSFSTVLSHDGIHLITASVSDSGGEDNSDEIILIVGICDNDGICEAGENCNICPSDCIGDGITFCCGQNSCQSGEDACNCSLDCGPPASSEQPSLTCEDSLDNDCDLLVDCDDQDCAGFPECPSFCNNNLACEPDLGEDCNTCPSDCNAVTTGDPNDRFCCGDDVDCSDLRCSQGGFICLEDSDGDLVSDPYDNCLVLVNGPGTLHMPNPRPNGSSQCDDDLDGFGNACDCDFNQNGYCTELDFAILYGHFGEPVDSSNAIYDIDCDQIIGFSDVIFMSNHLGYQMGVDDPLLSGLACADPRVTAGSCQSP